MTTVPGDSSAVDADPDGDDADAPSGEGSPGQFRGNAAESTAGTTVAVSEAATEAGEEGTDEAGAVATDEAADATTDEAADATADEAAGPADADATDSELSVVVLVPAYNEAETVGEVVRAAKPHADEVIVVDDASDDDTAERARDVADGVVSHSTNLGVGAALHTGYRVALREEYDVVVQLDADGQHDPARIPDLVAELTETDADIVVGSRWLNSSHEEYSPVRRLGIRFFTLEANLLGGVDVTDITSGYRVYDADVLADLGRPANGHWALEQTLEAARKGYDLAEVSVRMPPESEGSQFDLETFAKYPARMALSTLKVLIFR